MESYRHEEVPSHACEVSCRVRAERCSATVPVETGG
jgi:hypothetical protein